MNGELRVCVVQRDLQDLDVDNYNTLPRKCKRPQVSKSRVKAFSERQICGIGLMYTSQYTASDLQVSFAQCYNHSRTV